MREGVRALVFGATLVGLCQTGALGISADLDRDGTLEYVSITHKQVINGHPMGGEILVSHRFARALIPHTSYLVTNSTGGKLKVIWRQPRLNPWKLQIGDVDGDGHKEVVVGVYKKSRYDPVFAKRAFVYSWNGKRLMPKWLGSRLSRRFTDFVLCPLDRDSKTELVALEIAGKGSSYVTAYRWNAFGFDWLGRTGPVKNAISLSAKNRCVFVTTNRSRYSLVHVKGRYTLTPEAGIEKQTGS